MTKKIGISDNGDEVVYISLVETDLNKVLCSFELDHETHGWESMRAGIDAIKKIAAAFELEVIDTQDIV